MRALACLLILSSCAAQRLALARSTGATAMSCAPEDLWVFEDESGWAATGCGQIVSGTEPGQATERGKATCEGLARFEFRLCRAIAHQSRPVTTNLSVAFASGIAQAQSENACNDQLAMRYAACPQSQTVPGLPGSTPPDAPIVPDEIPPNP